MGEALARSSLAAAPRHVVMATCAVAAVVCGLYLFIGLRGNIGFVLGLRLSQLLGLVQVAVSVAVSTVIFQTITGNRILTPSIMGLDALYLFCQTALVFALGGFGYATLPSGWKFSGEVILMMAASAALFLPMLRRSTDMMLMILTGFVLGFLFHSLTALLARLIDPNAFAVVQGASFASFQSLDRPLLVIGAILTAFAALVAWRARHVLDVIALGREAAIGLGLDWNRWVTGLLLLVAGLVATSTALVGPLAFLGLLVVALAERLCTSQRHGMLLPAAAGIAVIVLVGAQTLARSGIGGTAVVSIIVEFAGGLVFLALLFARRHR